MSPYEMNQEVKALWLEALRSGDYRRAEGKLHRTANGEEYCCLGVLCDLAVKAGLPVEVEPALRAYMRYDGFPDTLPESVMEWAGLMDSSPDTPHGELVALNDDGMSFDDIANVIEEYL